MDPPVRLLERIDDAIFSLDVAFDRALETFATLRRGVALNGSVPRCLREDGGPVHPEG